MNGKSHVFYAFLPLGTSQFQWFAWVKIYLSLKIETAWTIFIERIFSLLILTTQKPSLSIGWKWKENNSIVKDMNIKPSNER